MWNGLRSSSSSNSSNYFKCKKILVQFYSDKNWANAKQEMILAKTFMVKMSEEWWESQVKVLLKMSFRIFKFFGKKLAKLAMHFKSILFGRLTLNFFPTLFFIFFGLF
jgi:hypothetical protein